VFGRGLERRAIFGAEAGRPETERDREHFLELWAEAHERYRLRIHAYALLDNHYHAIVQTPEANLSAALQWLHGSYSAWYNARHQRVGPLFQGRFRAIPVEDGAWSYALSHYVHLNPVRIAGLGLDQNGWMLEGKGWRTPSREEVDARLRTLREYRWSSYRAYAGYAPAPAWLETGELLSRAHGQPEQRQRAYRAAVRRLLVRGEEPGRLERLRDAVAIGSADFAQRVRAWGAEAPLDGVSGKRDLYRRAPVAEVRRVVEEAKGEPWERFAERHGDWGCALFLWGVRRVCGLTLREAGQAAGGIAESAVHKAIQRLAAQAARDPALREAQQRILKLSEAQP
jgi:REP element-mobilizing transposase RayT